MNLVCELSVSVCDQLPPSLIGRNVREDREVNTLINSPHTHCFSLSIFLPYLYTMRLSSFCIPLKTSVVLTDMRGDPSEKRGFTMGDHGVTSVDIEGRK